MWGGAPVPARACKGRLRDLQTISMGNHYHNPLLRVQRRLQPRSQSLNASLHMPCGFHTPARVEAVHRVELPHLLGEDKSTVSWVYMSESMEALQDLRML